MSDEDILATAKKRFQLAVEAESEIRREALDDLKFMVGEQWPDQIKQSRNLDNRPCLTINRLGQSVKQVTNDQRQNRPSIKINPVDDQADVETAKIFQGIVRHVEYASRADIAYDGAFEATAKAGLGYFRLMTDYSDPMSFQQEILIKRIKDRFSVYMDPFYEEPDGSDAEWGFIIDDMPKDDYLSQYSDSELASMADWESLGRSEPEWVKTDSVRVAEYYYKTYEMADLVLLGDQTVMLKSQYESLPKDAKKAKILKERKTKLCKVKWCKINGHEILERTEVPGSFIPIIPVLGEEEIIDGKRYLAGIIRPAKDSQRMYNYWASAETETIALAPRAPFIGVEGQFEGYEEQWKTANTRNHAYLEYKAKTIGGEAAPAPQRNVYEPPVQAITQARAQSADDLKATTGIYDASLGNRSNETSGVAIQRRNTQAQTSNFHFIDNLSRSLRHAGRIIVSWIPKIYDTAQVVRVIGEDGEIDMVKVNQIFEENGEQKSHFLDTGRYDVTVDTGPSFQTKRQESVASMLDLTRALPQAMANALDLVVRNMDWPGAQEIAERIKKTLPPNITDDGKGDKPQIPPQAQQQMMQMQQMIKVLTQEVNENAEIIKTKILELQSKERIAMAEMENNLIIERLKHDAKDAQIAFTEELKHLRERSAQLASQTVVPNGLGGDQPAGPGNSEEQPTGGPSPGTPMGV